MPPRMRIATLERIIRGPPVSQSPTQTMGAPRVTIDWTRLHQRQRSYRTGHATSAATATSATPRPHAGNNDGNAAIHARGRRGGAVGSTSRITQRC